MHRLASSPTPLTALLFVAPWLVCGCGATQASPDAYVPPVDAACTVGGGTAPWLILGTGNASFIELSEGAEIELVHGPQGGYHLESTAVLGLVGSPDMHVLAYDVRRTDGTLLGETQLALAERRLTRACGGWFRGGDFVVLTITGPADVAETEVDMRVRVLMGDVEIVSDARRLRVVDRAP